MIRQEEACAFHAIRRSETDSCIDSYHYSYIYCILKNQHVDLTFNSSLHDAHTYGSQNELIYYKLPLCPWTTSKPESGILE
jgi:hypothetical protein